MRVQALEKNILKYRALEMLLVLFHAEALKRYVLGSIRSTDQIFGEQGEERLPDGTKKLVKKAFSLLVDDGILTEGESRDVRALIDYRNDIAHSTYKLVGDISLGPNPWDQLECQYRYSALERLLAIRDKVAVGFQAKGYVQTISLDQEWFRLAESTYKEEMARLAKKIDRQLLERKVNAGN